MITPEINVFLGFYHAQKSLSKFIVRYKSDSHISQIRDFVNPTLGSCIPLLGNVSHTRDFTISHFWESYPGNGILLYPTLGNHIPNMGIRHIPF